MTTAAEAKVLRARRLSRQPFLRTSGSAGSARLNDTPPPRAMLHFGGRLRLPDQNRLQPPRFRGTGSRRLARHRGPSLHDRGGRG